MAVNSPTDPTYIKIVNPPAPQLAYAEVAHPHAKGIIYNGTMKPSIAEKYKNEGYSFCMRSLNAPAIKDSSGNKEQLDPYTISLTAQETNRVTGASDKHGYGLALMPIYDFNTTPTPPDFALDILNLLSAAAIPIGTTVWLKWSGSTLKQSEVQSVEQQIFQSGYSVGILGDEVQQQQQTNGRVLESTYTPFEQSCSGTQIRTIAIGDNTGSYPIYWAIQ
ncbi:hypothetical protein JF50_00935 [Pseudoalteromonas luteoviolacea]|uniref:DUF1906 domain-containing protein n=1 Tax=Pseudoalteromonas luteoviolacea TaxID=43657 RepID=A0A0C1QVG4_9GAMM|nr:hypothetical protein [Pseudoalteromonas luteoviolacea]KID59052.1 hypothetical protein JF50_00935 [Pseudoalteromonas luteoviolacea]